MKGKDGPKKEVREVEGGDTNYIHSMSIQPAERLLQSTAKSSLILLLEQLASTGLRVNKGIREMARLGAYAINCRTTPPAQLIWQPS